MNELKPFTYEDIRKGPRKGEQIRIWQKWLKEQREKDKLESKNTYNRMYMRQKRTEGVNP